MNPNWIEWALEAVGTRFQQHFQILATASLIFVAVFAIVVFVSRRLGKTPNAA